MTASARQRPVSRVPHLPKPVADLPPCGRKPSTAAVSSGLTRSSSGQGRRGRNARATSRALRVSGSFPRQFALVNRRLPLSLPQSSSKARNSHVSLGPTLFQVVATCNTKSAPRCAETVDVETSLWKP